MSMTPARFRQLVGLSITTAIGAVASVGGACSTTDAGAGGTTGAGQGPQPCMTGGTVFGEFDECFEWPGNWTAGSSSVASSGTGDAPCPTVEQANAIFAPSLSCGTIDSILGPATKTMDGYCCYLTKHNCCSGRPLVIEGEQRLAHPTSGSNGWASRMAPSLDGLDASSRASLAKVWRDDAVMEHASVASFARFALELVAVGAPADLVSAAHAAALDEIEHARLCFALASSYGGGELSPGPLDVVGLTIRSDLSALAASAVEEGCVGETIAAAMAAERLAGATDPAVRRALTKIAEGEARHATLAFRFVAWAIAAGGDTVRGAVRSAFDAALGRPLDGGLVVLPDGGEQGALRAHGIAGEADLRAGVRAVIAEVIAPAATQLLGARSAAVIQAPEGPQTSVPQPDGQAVTGPPAAS